LERSFKRRILPLKKKYNYLIIIILTVVSLAAFGRIAGNDFINFDDTGYIIDNLNIKSGFNYESIKWAFSSLSFYYWQPLTWLSHMLDWSLFGANASGHHLVSLFLHIGAVIFLFLFLNKTTNNIWPSAFAAALFALHPLRVESVAWAAERKDVLSMFFGMACLYAYAFWTEKEKLFQYFLCLILFAGALMSKPMMVTLPFVLMLLDYWPLNRWQKALDKPATGFNLVGKHLWEKVPFICLTIISSIITFYGQSKFSALAPLDILPFQTRMINMIDSYAAYLSKIFWPINLAVYYPYNFSIPPWKILISATIIILITFAVLYYVRKLPFLFVGWFWYLGTFVPLIGFIQAGMQAMADRHTYLPFIGIAIMITWGIPLLFPNKNTRHNILFPAGVAIIIFLSVLTWRQCGYWKNSATIFNHAIRVTKDNDRAHNNLGSYYSTQNQMMKAIYHFNQAINISPNYGTYNNRGNAYAKLGEYQLAVDDFSKSISLNPDYTEAYYNRGTSYGKSKQYQFAIEDFNKAISLNNTHIKAYNNRGIIYTKLGLHQKAIDDFNKAISIKPDYADAYSNRSLVYFNMVDMESGCRDAQKACELGNCTALQAATGKGFCR
jgi:protein O-mannosyl-transferase